MVKKVKNESDEFENENVVNDAELDAPVVDEVEETTDDDSASDEEINSIVSAAKAQQNEFDWDKYEAEKGGYSEAERNSLQNKYEQTLSTNAENEVTEMTNKMLKENAENIKQATIETAKQSERGIVDIETLKFLREFIDVDVLQDVQVFFRYGITGVPFYGREESGDYRILSEVKGVEERNDCEGAASCAESKVLVPDGAYCQTIG